MLAYQSDLLEIGGRNPYGEPTFLLCKGSDPIQRKDGSIEYNHITAYPQDWVLFEWMPRSEFGPPDDWVGEPYGDYPYRGRYTILQPFPKQKLDTLHLNPRVVRMIAWRSRQHRHDSLRQRQAAFRDHAEREDQLRQAEIADCLQNAFPQFTGPTSFAHNPTTRTAVQNKLEKLEDLERRGLLRQNPSRGLTVR